LECVQGEEGEVLLAPGSPLASASSTEPVINLIFRYKQVHTVYTKVRLTVSVEGTEPIVGHKSSNSPLEKCLMVQLSSHDSQSYFSYFNNLLAIHEWYNNTKLRPNISGDLIAPSYVPNSKIVIIIKHKINSIILRAAKKSYVSDVMVTSFVLGFLSPCP